MANKFSKLDKRRLQEIIRTSPGKLDKALQEMAVEIVADMQSSMGSSPPGRSYTHGNVTHVASQAGYPPNVDTGRLRASLHSRKVKALHYQVEDGTEYGFYLEAGTSNMAARPFMRPAFEKARQKFIATIRSGLL